MQLFVAIVVFVVVQSLFVFRRIRGRRCRGFRRHGDRCRRVSLCRRRRRRRRRLTAPVTVAVGLVAESRPRRAQASRIAAQSAAQQRLQAAYRRRAGGLAEQAVKHGQHVGAVAGRHLDQRRVRQPGPRRPRQYLVRLHLPSPLAAAARRAQVQLNQPQSYIVSK